MFTSRVGGLCQSGSVYRSTLRILLIFALVVFAAAAEASQCAALRERGNAIIKQHAAIAAQWVAYSKANPNASPCSPQSMRFVDLNLASAMRVQAAIKAAMPCTEGQSFTYLKGSGPEAAIAALRKLKATCLAANAKAQQQTAKGETAGAETPKPGPRADTARPSPSAPATTKSASCSDITGTGSKAPAARNCNQAKSALNAARAEQKKNPARSAEQYRKAADSYRRAGDTAQADAVLREAGLLVAAAPNPPAEASRESQPPSDAQPQAQSGSAAPTVSNEPAPMPKPSQSDEPRDVARAPAAPGAAASAGPSEAEACGYVAEVVTTATATQAEVKRLDTYNLGFDDLHKRCEMIAKAFDDVVTMGAAYCPARKQELVALQAFLEEKRCSWHDRERYRQCRDGRTYYYYGGSGGLVCRWGDGPRRG